MADDTTTTSTPSGPRTERKKIALAAVGGGLAVVLIGAGAVAMSGMANADTGASPTPTASGSPGDPGRGRGPGHAPGPWGAMFGLADLGMLGHLGDALHGSAVVKDDDGTFVTYEAQRGTVTAVSTSAISVRSDDGYEHTYVVTTDTVVNRDGSIGDIATGADVMVVATLDGGTSTATRVVDLSKLQQRLDEMKQRFEQRPDGNGNGVPPRLGPWHRGESGDNGAKGDHNKGGGTATPAPSASPKA